MKPIQITIDEQLLQKVDQAIKEIKVARSQFISEALEFALRRLEIEELEQRQVNGYRDHPIIPGEFDFWESEQSWGNE